MAETDSSARWILFDGLFSVEHGINLTSSAAMYPAQLQTRIDSECCYASGQWPIAL